jgi:uroporphyrinogen-III decarboxylase
MVTGLIRPDDRMTSRERMLAAYRGREVDRLPFWAKVANDTWRTSQPEAVRKLTDRELLDLIGADGIFGTPGFARVVRPRVTVEQRTDGNIRTTVTGTPDGELVERITRDTYTNSWHPTEFPIKTRQDIARYRWLFDDVRVEVDPDGLAKARRRVSEVGQRGIAIQGWGTSPLMHLVEHVIGPLNVHYMLADHADEVDGLIATMHSANCMFLECVAKHTPADAVVSVENTSTTLISPQQFRRYCLKHLRDYGRIIEGRGKMHELHMCGHTKVLLDEIDTIPASSIEAFTAPPLGNTRLVDGRTKAPSKTLVGGTNAMLWLRPVEEIAAFIEAELAACPDRRRIVVTTAGVAPPACKAEKFGQVADFVTSLC